MKRRFPRWPRWIPKKEPVFRIYIGPKEATRNEKPIQ